MSRFAAIDVGTNAIRCHIVEVAKDGRVDVLESVREPVRLGHPVFLTGRIGEPAATRTLKAFRLFRRLIDASGVDRIRAVATSAVREAADSDGLLARILEETGIRIKTIDGAEEAHLVRRAVSERLDLSKGRTVAVDVGGGSVELLVLKDGDIVRTESFTVGAVRLLEALKSTSGEAGAEFVTLLNDYLDGLRSRIRAVVGTEPVDLYAATGGSIETLATLAGSPAVGPRVKEERVRYIPLEALREWTLTLSGCSFNERVERFGLREDRADVILPAAAVYLKIGEILGAEGVHVPGVGLKDGLIRDMIEELERKGAVSRRRREIRSSALALGRRYALDEPHALKVTELALSLFDQLEKLHGLDDEARTLLEASGLLHDIGIYISTSKHHKHSYYIISETDLVGLDRRQRQIVANVARYHRRRHPTTKHPHFASLSAPDQELTRRLAAILRVADVLDREHGQHVESVMAVRRKRRIDLVLDAQGDLLLERWASAQKFGLFEEVFGLALRLKRRRGGDE